MRQRRNRNNRMAKWNERFATRVLLIIAITSALFIAAQYVSFLITQQEQSVLIQYYFTVVGLECGGLLLKRVSEVITARIRKTEKLNIAPDEGDGNADKETGGIDYYD